MAYLHPDERADGFLCPSCGRTLSWIGSVRGGAFVRKSFEVRLSEPVSQGDRMVKEEVSRTAFEVRTRDVWMHRVSLECKPCGRRFSKDQAAHGMPVEDEPASVADLPQGLREAFERARAASANAVQTGGGPGGGG